MAGDFAEDKDVAARLREEQIRPALATGHRVVLDFGGVRVATQSFVHAVISEVLRTYGESVLNRLTFRGCSKAVRGIIETVVQYSLESLDEQEYGPAGEKAPPRRRKK
jgi:hypothetical protein